MSFLRFLFLGLLASAPLAAGCHEPTPLPAGAAFEVGTGDQEFQALDGGTAVPINHGFQGGTHIWFSARFKGIDPIAALTYVIEDEEGNEIGDEQEAMIAEEADADGWHTATGLTALVDEDTPQGLHVVLRGYLEDESGHEMEARGKAVVKGEELDGGDDI